MDDDDQWRLDWVPPATITFVPDSGPTGVFAGDEGALWYDVIWRVVSLLWDYWWYVFSVVSNCFSRLILGATC